MNILVAVNNQNIVKRIKHALKYKDITLKYISNIDKLNEKIPNSFNSYFFETILEVEYDIMILDQYFFNSIRLKNTDSDIDKDGMRNFSTLLLVEDFNILDIKILVETKISSIMLISFSNIELLTNIILLGQSIHDIKKIQSSIFIDPLTSLFNRRTFINSISRYFYIYQQYQIPFCLGIIDLDHFKKINDDFGHMKGDEVLTLLASIMRKISRKTDILVRIGGEEFAVILPDTKLEEAYKILERIRKGVMNTKEIEDIHKVTLSAGLTISSKEHQSYEDMIRVADSLLYKAKNLGRNQVCK